MDNKAMWRILHDEIMNSAHCRSIVAVMTEAAYYSPSGVEKELDGCGIVVRDILEKHEEVLKQVMDMLVSKQQVQHG